jgi:hypothetical protein
VPIKIIGTDALGQTFQESTVTVMIDCYGCKYQSRHYAPKGSPVSIEIRRLDAIRSSKVVQAKVVWVQRPKTYREVYHVALALEVPGNVWGIPWPPSDWFPCPGEEMTVAETPVEEPMAAAIASSPLADTGRGLSAQLAVADEVVLDCTVEMMTALEKSKPRLRAAGQAAYETQLAALQQTARFAAAEAVSEQIAAMQDQIAVAMKELIEQNTARMSATLEETRKELQALREAVNAQLPRRGKGQSSKRRSKVPTQQA